MSDRRVSIVLVSVGMYGQKYLHALTEQDVGGDLVGIVDIAPGLDVRYPVIREKHIPVFPSLEAFYAAEKADLAILCSPIHLHAQMVHTCLRNGSHVLCEKPLCLTETETRSMAEAAQKAQRVLAVGWQLNYHPGLLQLKQDILRGRFGAPVRFQCLHAMRRGENYYGRSNWAGKIQVDGREVLDSPFMNACAHHFQLMTFLLGDDMASACMPVHVEGELWRGNPNVENYDIAALRFQTGAGIPILYYTAHPLETKNLGQKGIGILEDATLRWGRGEHYRVITKNGEELDYGAEDTLPMRKLYDMVEAVKHGTPVPCSALAGLGHLAAVRMAQTLPVADIAPEHVIYRTEQGDRFPCVQHLESVLESAADAWALPREIGLSL